MALKVHLVCIDVQNDFTNPNGALFVKGAVEDTLRTAAMIRRLTDKLSDIHLTVDSHRIVDISHPIWWCDENGKSPAPFTMISTADVAAGKWRTRQFGAMARSVDYLQKLEATKRYPHVIWPEHCLIGDWGQSIDPVLSAAVHEWERKRYALADIVTKGSNPYTEHFSAVRAEVPDPKDASTQLNTRLVQTIEEADLVGWAGQARDYCLANTMRDTFAAFRDPSIISKMVLITDATSDVGMPAGLGDAFVAEMTAKGMRLSTTTDFLA